MRADNATFAAEHRAVLESIAAGAPLSIVLTDIVLLIERQADGMLCSILLVDENRLRHGAAPSLPSDYNIAVHGSEIGPKSGSCGTAAYLRERVIVEDIATHPYWDDYRHHALRYGLKACWSTPIVSPSGDVLGTFAMYYKEARGPVPQEVEWVDTATHLASIAILRDRTEQDLRRSESRARELARLHAVSSTINKLMLRARDPQHLYELACRIAVQEGLARLAWIGVLNETANRVEIVAQYGGVAELPIRTFDLEQAEFRQGLTARALSSGEPAVAADLLETVSGQWREWLEHRNLRSCALFPLKDRERIVGVFTLYASQLNYFRDEELQVLTSLAADLSFAVESARNEIERRRMEEAVRASEHLRALIFSTVGDGIFYLQCERNERYVFVAVNRAFLEMFGTAEEHVVGKCLNDLLPDAMRDHVLERLRYAAETQSRVTWEEKVPTRSSTRHVEITIVPMFGAQGVCENFVGTLHDITARIQAETERVRLEAQLNQSQRIQSLGTLAGGIAHDFNNILTAISGNAGLALQEPNLDSVTRTHLMEIQKASRRAIDLVRQILTFSRQAPPKREALDPREVVREALNLLRATLPQTIAIETEFAPDAPNVEGDSTQLHQIVMNLGTNAAHALSPRGGFIRVKLEKVVIAQDAAVAGLAPGRYLRMQVIDNGCGMDETAIKHAFDPFFTTRKPGEGTGLGLSVVHGIVQSHRGAVEIRSQLNRGTTVSVYLPATDDEAEQPRTPRSTPQGSGERVMYVDDEEALVFLMERALTKLGYRVTGFSDPKAALVEFRAHPHAFDVVITDVSMPGLSGPDLAAEMRRIREHVPIIMTSGYIRQEDVDVAQRLNINQLVYKANTVEALGEALAREIQALSGPANAKLATN
jgi:PAS domain S-box-containing protein